MTIVKVLNSSEIAAARSRGNSIAAVATPTISSNQFVFFTAFDGTNNDRTQLWKS